MDCSNLMVGWCQQQYFSLILCWVRVGGGCRHWKQLRAELGGPAWPQPSSPALMEVCQAGFVALQWLFCSSLHTVAHELFEFIVRRTPLLLETCSSCFLMFFHYTGKECGYINIWLSLVVCLCRCISVADVFLFWAEMLFPSLCGPCPSLCAQ